MPSDPAPPDASVRPSPWSRLLTAFVVAGCVLRAVQWGAGTSLWHDELLLVRSVLDVGLGSIATSGLPENQVAPLAFVALTKGAVAAFGAGERALRLVPFLASLGGMLAFAHLARKVLGARGAAVAVGAFALNPLLVGVAGAVKQYSSDALVTILLLMAFRRIADPGTSARHRMALGVGAGLLGFLSIPSVFVAGPALALLCLMGLRASRAGQGVEGRSLIAAGVAWGIVAGAAALEAHAAVSVETRAFMEAFWSRWGVFMPPVLEYPTWVLDAARDRMIPSFLMRPYMGNRGSDGLTDAVAAFGAALAAVGLIRIGIARRFRWVLLLALPVAGSLVAARLGLYPLVPRTSIHLLVPLLLLIGAACDTGTASPTGATSLAGTARRRFRGGDLVAGATLAGLAVVGFDAGPPPFTVQPVRELLEELAALRVPGEPVVAHVDAEPALTRYGPSLGLTGVEVPPEEGVPALLAALDRHRGEGAVWVVFANQEGDRDRVLCALDAVGRETERRVLVGVRLETPVSIHRYDLRGALAPIVPPVSECPSRRLEPGGSTTSPPVP